MARFFLQEATYPEVYLLEPVLYAASASRACPVVGTQHVDGNFGESQPLHAWSAILQASAHANKCFAFFRASRAERKFQGKGARAPQSRLSASSALVAVVTLGNPGLRILPQSFNKLQPEKLKSSGAESQGRI